MALFSPQIRKLLVAICLSLVLLLGSLAGSCPRCEAAPSFSYGSGTGGAAEVTCTSTGGYVSNVSSHGGSVASCYAYSGGSSPPPSGTRSERSGAPSPSPAGPPSSSGCLSSLISFWVSAFALVSIMI